MATATDLHEAELAQWLFTGFSPSHLLASELGLVPGTRFLFRTDTRVVAPNARGPGDIDVLAIGPGRPEGAVAIEVKCVKMPADSYWTSLPNKLQEIEKGRKQVGLLRKIGFHRSYLLVAVVADGREHVEVNFASRGPTPALVKAVKDKLRNLDFHPEVGVIVIEATQPIDKDIFDAGAVGIWTQQAVTTIPQPPELTTSIASLCDGSTRTFVVR